MFDAQNIEGTTWLVTETDDDGEVIGTHKVAVKTGGTGDDAIAAIEEARNPPPPGPDQLFAQRLGAVKAECGNRIYAVADQIAQMNLTAAASAGFMTASQMTTWQLALQWVNDMRGTCLPLIADAAVDYTADASWPDVPDGVADLAAQF